MAKLERVVLPIEISDWVETVLVKCVSFDSLISRFNLEIIDLLIIDVEGYEYEIIKLIPFNRITIKNLIFEYHNLDKYSRIKIETILIDNGFTLEKAKRDIIAKNKTF
jgi:hypothetical protein